MLFKKIDSTCAGRWAELAALAAALPDNAYFFTPANPGVWSHPCVTASCSCMRRAFGGHGILLARIR